ncbi:MAG: PulJ/GspJ family protein [Armatimonadota bacterium]
MRRLGSVNKTQKNGFTLVEVLVVSTVLALLLTSLCGIYLSVAGEWERQGGQGTALVATSMACTRLSEIMSQATGAVVLQRFEPGDAIAVNLPADRAGGIYVPVWNSGKVQYQSGNWVVFYLSDSTGNYNRTGDILWSASMNWGMYPRGIVPDAGWSLYYNQPIGRVAPISSLQFSMSTDDRPLVTIVATSEYKAGATQATLRQHKSICLQNAN